MALYNKYRPNSLSMVCGQEQIKRILANQVRNNKLVHAYLFTGSAGIGKTTVARIFAAMINCSKGMMIDIPADDPFVASILAGHRSMDIIEMDAASNRGIDDIKEIRDKAYSAPMEMRKKVYIIDECHQLTSEAWNALLKILEEPPQHAIFILCTTDQKKVLETIKTRCQCFEFRPILMEDITKQVKAIATAEAMEIDEDAIRMVASSARGSLRNAISKLEKLQQAGERITSSVVSKTLGVTSRQTTSDFVNAVIDANLLAGIKASSDAIAIGVPAEDFFVNVAEYCHDMMMFGAKGYDVERLGYSPEEAAAIQGSKAKIQDIFGDSGKLTSRKMLLNWIDLLEKYRNLSIFKLQPQFLTNVAFIALFNSLKSAVAHNSEKGGAA